jgi:hypothetical protein
MCSHLDSLKQYLTNPRIKKSMRVIPNLLPHTCSLAVFAAAMVDINLQNASPNWFTKGWKDIGIIAIVSLSFTIIESIVFLCKLSRHSQCKKKSAILKLLSEFFLWEVQYCYSLISITCSLHCLW